MATSTLGSGTLVLAGTTSGTTTVTATAVAGTTTLTLPAATDTLVGKATTDTLTNKTLTSPTLTGVATFAAGSAAAPAITTTGDTNTGMWFPAADTIAFTEGGVEAMRIDSSGNVGVGVTPNAWLSLTGLQTVGGGSLTSNTNSTFIGANWYYDGANKYIANGFASRYILENGSHQWYSAANNTSGAGAALNFTQAMTLDASGNLGIGTTSPAQRLNVATASGNCYARVDRASQSTGQVGYQWGGGTSSTDWLVYLPASSNDLTFFGNSAERMRLDSSGNVGIGTSSPIAKLDISGISTSQNGLRLTATSGGQALAAFTADTSTGEIRIGGTVAAAGNYFPVFYAAGSERARIDSSGNLGIGVTPSAWSSTNAIEVGSLGTALWSSSAGSTSLSAGAYYNSGWKYANSTTKPAVLDFETSGKINTYTVTATGTAGNAATLFAGPFVANGGISWTNGSSDVRLKKNFETSQGLAELLQIEPVKFHFDWEEDSVPKRLGFKAQNLLPLIPEMVVEKEDKAEDGTPYLTITPDYILPVLVKAIQEQQALITQLTARITALEGA